MLGTEQVTQAQVLNSTWGIKKKKAKKSSPILSIEVVLLFRDDKMDKGEKEVSVIQ